MIPEFEYFIKKGAVRKDVKDVNRAKSVIKIAIERLKTAKKLENPNFKLEFAYEVVIELIEAVLLLKGFKSYSHEANIAFFRELKFPEDKVIKLDLLRRKRHRSKYYGQAIDKKEAEEALKIAMELKEKLLEICKKWS